MEDLTYVGEVIMAASKRRRDMASGLPCAGCWHAFFQWQILLEASTEYCIAMPLNSVGVGPTCGTTMLANINSTLVLSGLATQLLVTTGRLTQRMTACNPA